MIVFISLLLICLMSYHLIINDNYDDGIVGRGALGVMSLTSGLGCIQLLYGKVSFDPVSEAMFMAVAVFEARHIYRVYRAKTNSHNALETFKRLFN